MCKYVNLLLHLDPHLMCCSILIPIHIELQVVCVCVFGSMYGSFLRQLIRSSPACSRKKIFHHYHPIRIQALQCNSIIVKSLCIFETKKRVCVLDAFRDMFFLFSRKPCGVTYWVVVSIHIWSKNFTQADGLPRN